MGDSLKNYIKKKLPDISEDKMQILMEKLEELGVQGAHWQQYAGAIQESDLEDCIPVVMKRILVSSWKENASNSVQRNQQSVEEPSTPSAEVSLTSQELSQRYMKVDIDFESFNPQMKVLIKKKTINENEKGQIKRYVCAQIKDRYKLERGLPTSSCTYIARQLAEKNAAFYDDEKQKDVIFLATALGRHLIYKVSTSKRDANTAEEPSSAPPKRQRSGPLEVQKNEYGLIKVNYDLVAHTTTETADDIQLLKNEHEKNRSEWDMALVSEKMTSLQLHIRYNLLEKKIDCRAAKAEFPYLFEGKFMLAFFTYLTGIDAEIQLDKFLDSLLEPSYNFFTRYSNRRERDDLMIDVDKKMISAMKELPTLQPKMIATLMLAQIHFLNGKFDEQDVIKTMKEDELDFDSEQSSPMQETAPTIIAFGDDVYTANQFALVIDGVLAMRISGITKALSFCFAAFYVFGAQYPENTYTLWEFIQRVIFDLNPAEDDKNTNTRGISKKGGGKQTVSLRVTAVAAAVKQLRLKYNSQ